MGDLQIEAKYQCMICGKIKRGRPDVPQIEAECMAEASWRSSSCRPVCPDCVEREEARDG